MTENVCKLLDNLSRHNSRAYGYELSQNEVLQILKLFDDVKELEQYRAIGTIEEFKALKEKSVAKKPNQVSKAMDKDKYVGLIGRCPNCGSIVAEDNLVCEDCFQVLDWSRIERSIYAK